MVNFRDQLLTATNGDGGNGAMIHIPYVMRPGLAPSWYVKDSIDGNFCGDIYMVGTSNLGS